jgi:glycerol-3-phosphate dehydrogenase (NAD(P)+)
MSAIGILGAGSWGTALAIAQAAAGREVRLWARREELAAEMARSRRNPYLPDTELPPSILPTHDLAMLAGCDPLLVVVPSHGLRAAVRDLLAVLPGSESVTLVSASKGVEADTMLRMSEVCAAEAERAGRALRFAVLCGPTFAAEVAAGAPTAAVIAATSPALAAELRHTLSSGSFRLYSSTDVVGVELGAAAKNVIAIAAGVIAGLGLGHNTLAALITRGLHEMTRLGVACGARPHTLAGLAGLGDLVLTCTGHLSRNRRTGELLAQGKNLAEIAALTPMVAEGVRNSLTVRALADSLGVEMPIIAQMVAVLHHGKPPRQALEDLMRRELKAEDAL